MNLKKLAKCKQEWGLRMTESKGKFPAFGINFINTKKNAPRNGSFSEHFVYGLNPAVSGGMKLL